MTEQSGSTVDLARHRDVLLELVPVVRRTAGLDPGGIARLRLGGGTATVLVRLPFDVLVSRSITSEQAEQVDVTVGATALLRWLDGETSEPPDPRDAEWRSGLPPVHGWQRVDVVPDEVVRGLVRTGALALKEAAAREGVPNAQPRAEVADALLDAVVLTMSADGIEPVEVTLRTLSALVRMGFLPRGSHIAVAVAGRWIRVAAEYGSVYAERPGSVLGILTR